MSPNARYISSFIATVAALHIIDGPWHRWSTDKAIDPWFFTHIGWGVIAARMGITPRDYWLMVAANGAVEMLSRAQKLPIVWGSRETPANVVMDVVANAVGYYPFRREA